MYIQVGTGFSYTDKGGMSTNEDEVAENLYSCITQFLTVFSEYQASEFYVTGEVSELISSRYLIYLIGRVSPFVINSLALPQLHIYH